MSAGQVLLALEAISKQEAADHVRRIKEHRIAMASDESYVKIMRALARRDKDDGN